MSDEKVKASIIFIASLFGEAERYVSLLNHDY